MNSATDYSYFSKFQGLVQRTLRARYEEDLSTSQKVIFPKVKVEGTFYN